VLLGAAAAAVVAGGAVIAATWHVSFGHGLYCSLGTASTVGCDVAPPGTAGRLAAAAVMLTAIPLLAAAFASLHLDQVRKHVDASLGEHRRSVHTRLDRLERGRSGEKGAL
jgi:hypothetical protein